MAFFEDDGNRRIFLNPVALDYSFIPKLIPYRENQQHRKNNSCRIPANELAI